MITGRSASRSSAAARSIARGSAVARGDCERGSGAASDSGTSMNTWSSGKSRNVGPECGACATRNASSTIPGISAVVRGRRGELRQRANERDVVDLLERPLPPPELRRASPEHDQRRVVLRRRRDRAHPVGHARPGGQRAHADRPGDLRPALGGERRRLLVADVDQLDSLGAAAVVDREQVAAREREQLLHAVRAQAPGDQPSAVELGRRFRGHERHANTRQRRCSMVSSRRALTTAPPRMITAMT